MSETVEEERDDLLRECDEHLLRIDELESVLRDAREKIGAFYKSNREFSVTKDAVALINNLQDSFDRFNAKRGEG